MSNIEEVEPKEQPVAEGYLGNLNDEQHKALVGMWQSYFEICDKARGNAKKGSGFKEDTSGKDPKKSGIPEDDAAKDEAKKQAELQGMNELLETYGSEALRDSWWNFVRGDNPDGSMLRFVRARKGDVERGLAMMATMLRWRLDTDVESLVEKGDLVNAKEIPKFLEQQKSGKVFSLGCTGAEEPICYVIMKHHSIWGQPAASMQKFIVTQMETFRLLMGPPVDKATIFFDLKGFGMKQMDIVSLLYLVKVLESYYPESLAKMYVSNAPYVFWGFWRVVKNLLDPVVRNKIVFITGPAETGDHVPEDRMIKYCGGKVESQFDFVEPKKGENDIQNDTETRDKLKDRHHKLTDQFEKITREWCKGGGTDEGLEEKRKVLIKKLRLSQFELEPYTRGLTVYHRNGVLPIDSPGIATFDYELGSKTIRQVMGKPTCRKSVERELCEIASGSTTEEAESKTKEMLQDGSWGQWRVNDNSPEIKKKALATLEDIEGTAKPEQLEKAKPLEAAPASSSSAAPTSKQEGEEAAAAGAGGGAAAAAATSSKAKRKPSSSASSQPQEKKQQSSSTSQNSTGKPTSDTSGSTAVEVPTAEKPVAIPYTASGKGRKMMSKSPLYTDTTKKRGFFGSLRARIAAM